jgi:hypothetical protein
MPCASGAGGSARCKQSDLGDNGTARTAFGNMGSTKGEDGERTYSIEA